MEAPEKNVRPIESHSEPPWPVPPEYVSPWGIDSLAGRINAVPPDDCCTGLIHLVLEIVREADQKLSKALFDNWTLEGLLKEKQNVK